MLSLFSLNQKKLTFQSLLFQKKVYFFTVLKPEKSTLKIPTKKEEAYDFLPQKGTFQLYSFHLSPSSKTFQSFKNSPRKVTT